MERKKFLSSYSIWANRIVAGAETLFIFILPPLLEFFCAYRGMAQEDFYAILIAYYCCVPLLITAAHHTERLLQCIRSGEVFVPKNARRIRAIRWCTGGIATVTFPAALFYPPLLFVVVIMVFVMLMVSVMEKVMEAAIELREENDLTI